jgi:hypothetical protein
MEIADSGIFQIDDPLVKTAYHNNLNYEVVLSEGTDIQKDLCVIYFSSNEIYYPNTAQSFRKSIVNKDKYEWRNNRILFAYKHIFVRDIQKQWYVEGVNSSDNSPEKIADLLKSLITEFRVYAIGSSAGGFAAMLFGSMLKAERVYAFNAQLNLNIIINDSDKQTNPILFKYREPDPRSGYFRVDDFVTPATEYFYFQSCKSKIDVIQFESFKNKELVNCIRFKTANHGFPFFRNNLGYILHLPVNTLKEMTRKEHHPLQFAIKVDGFFKTIYMVSKIVFRRILKKIKEKKEAF